MTSCQICNGQDFKYKCPTCFIKFCSVQCFNVHKELPCEKPALAPPSENLPVEHPPLTYRFPTADTVPVEKLQALAHSDELKECLSNPHVRNILKSLVQSQTPETSITNAMKEPIFLELAHACLKIVEPEKFQHELGFAYLTAHEAFRQFLHEPHVIYYHVGKKQESDEKIEK